MRANQLLTNLFFFYVSFFTNHLPSFLRYILYWKKRFAEQPITDFCSVIRTNSQAPLGKCAACLLTLCWPNHVIIFGIQCCFDQPSVK